MKQRLCGVDVMSMSMRHIMIHYVIIGLKMSVVAFIQFISHVNFLDSERKEKRKR
ncbi:MAG: hypothetical protein OEY88_09890 [Candidatus Bathyarchaeota archaeon]|nr:hypothetical protein [Candidatus Bathyarchaeota archaeon]